MIQNALFIAKALFASLTATSAAGSRKGCNAGTWE